MQVVRRVLIVFAIGVVATAGCETLSDPRAEPLLSRMQLPPRTPISPPAKAVARPAAKAAPPESRPASEPPSTEAANNPVPLRPSTTDRPTVPTSPLREPIPPEPSTAIRPPDVQPPAGEWKSAQLRAEPAVTSPSGVPVLSPPVQMLNWTATPGGQVPAPLRPPVVVPERER